MVRLKSMVYLLLVVSLLPILYVQAWAQKLAICEAVDTSGSIPDADLELQIKGFKQALTDVLLPIADRGIKMEIAIVGFSRSVVLGLPLTLVSRQNESKIRDGYDEIARLSEREATNMSGAIRRCKDELKVSTARRKLINLSTDGVPTIDSGDPKEDTRQAAREAKNQGIEIWCIGVGPDLDPGFLGEICTRVFIAEDFKEFVDVMTSKICSIFLPIPDAGPDRTIKEGEIVRFRALGVPGNFSPFGLPLFFFWDFGDGSKAKGKKVSHVYADNGTFTVTLTVSDGRGCVVQDTAEVTVENVAPNAKTDGPILRARVGQPVHFFGRFGDPGKADTHTIEWDFGDGTTETFTLPADPWMTSPLTATHTYDAPGIYQVTLTVTDDDGDSDTATFEVRVFSNEARWLGNEKNFDIMSFRVEGPGIESIEVEIWDLSGRRVFESGEAPGNTLLWPLQNSNGEPLANGIYLYVIWTRDFDKVIIRSEVRKLVLLR